MANASSVPVEPVPVTLTESVLESILKHYGPYAFGIVSVLVIWFAIMKPQLDQRAVDFAANREIIQALRERDRAQESIARSMAETAETMSITAAILERAVNRLDDQ